MIAGDGLNRQAVSGHVTLAGEPLARGSVEFQPTDTSAPTVAGAPVEDGAYAIPAAAGLVPGTYRVVISAAAGPAAEDQPPGETPPPPKETIPARYNSQSTLTAEVGDGADNSFDFVLDPK